MPDARRRCAYWHACRNTRLIIAVIGLDDGRGKDASSSCTCRRIDKSDLEGGNDNNGAQRLMGLSTYVSSQKDRGNKRLLIVF